MSEIAVRGEIISYKSMADGGLRITVELDELEGAKFHEGFKPHNLVAVARLFDESAQSSEG